MTIDVNPFIARAGPFALTWQGLFIGIAIVAALWLAANHLRSDGMDPNLVYDALIWILLPAVVGGRLFHVLDSWDYYAVHPLDIFAVTRGGSAVYGAVVFGTGAGLFFARRRRLSTGKFFDALAPAQALALAIGRIGDLITGAYLGRPTNLPVAVRYVNAASFDQRREFVHPAAAYEIVWDLAILALLLWLRRLHLPRGILFWTFTALFATGQFWIGFLRDEPVDLFGLGQAQIVGALLLVVSLLAIAWIGRRRRRSKHRPGQVSAEFHGS